MKPGELAMEHEGSPTRFLRWRRAAAVAAELLQLAVL
jgi:hypothetical protein